MCIDYLDVRLGSLLLFLVLQPAQERGEGIKDFLLVRGNLAMIGEISTISLLSHL